MGFHFALGIFLRGVAEGEGVVAEDHRAARSEGLHVQAGIGTAPGIVGRQRIVGRQHGGRIHREGFAAGRRGRERFRCPLFPRGRNHPARPAGGFILGLNCIPVRFIVVEICFTKQ